VPPGPHPPVSPWRGGSSQGAANVTPMEVQVTACVAVRSRAAHHHCCSPTRQEGRASRPPQGRDAMVIGLAAWASPTNQCSCRTWILSGIDARGVKRSLSHRQRACRFTIHRLCYAISDSVRGRVVLQPVCITNDRILLANLLQGSRSTFSGARFPRFLAFKEGMLDRQVSALGSSPTVSGRILLANPLFGSYSPNYRF